MYIYIYILHCIIVHQYVIICNVGIEKEEQGGCILVFLLIRAMQDEVDPTVIWDLFMCRLVCCGVFFLCLAAWNAVSQVRQTDWWLTDYLDFDQLSSIAVTHSTPSEEPACVTVEICHQPTNQQHSLWIFFLEQVTGSYHIVTPMKIPLWVYWLLFICLAL